jgi:hypothetical protein
MKIYSYIRMNLEGEILDEVSYEYDGPIAKCDGSDSDGGYSSIGGPPGVGASQSAKDSYWGGATNTVGFSGKSKSKASPASNLAVDLETGKSYDVSNPASPTPANNVGVDLESGNTYDTTNIQTKTPTQINSSSFNPARDEMNAQRDAARKASDDISLVSTLVDTLKTGFGVFSTVGNLVAGNIPGALVSGYGALKPASNLYDSAKKTEFANYMDQVAEIGNAPGGSSYDSRGVESNGNNTGSQRGQGGENNELLKTEQFSTDQNKIIKPDTTPEPSTDISAELDENDDMLAEMERRRDQMMARARKRVGYLSTLLTDDLGSAPIYKPTLY